MRAELTEASLILLKDSILQNLSQGGLSFSSSTSVMCRLQPCWCKTLWFSFSNRIVQLVTFCSNIESAERQLTLWVTCQMIVGALSTQQEEVKLEHNSLSQLDVDCFSLPSQPLLL